MTLLDVGCGPGTITIDLARRLAPGRVVGLDAVDEPLAIARDEARAAGVDTVAFVVGDAYALPFDDGAFDVVHAHQLLQHLRDPAVALREMARVCRPGGLVAARDSDYGAKTWYPADPLLDRWLVVYHELARANGGEPDAGRRMLAWAHAAGLRDVTSSASSWCFATPSDRQWWGGLWADRVTESAFADQALAGGHATREELRSIADAFRRWAGDDDGWYIVTSGEILCRTTS
jgi:SAM-dependent methyltransferase